DTTHHSPLTTHQPKITDFGLALPLDQPTDLASSNQIVGTPSYMAPEQVHRDSGPGGPAADVYALGVILYELLTGRVPFHAGNPLNAVLLVLQQEPVSPSRLLPKFPPDLETICLKCLEKAALKRYASALNLAGDLRRFLDGRPIRARPVGPAERL